MPKWVEPTQSRDQLVLFPQRLDDVLPGDHPVRLFDDLMGQVDWSRWEAEYHNTTVGRPALRPRLLTSILLYGILCRIRASRQLEQAIEDRVDFRWLTQGLSADHSTLSDFRRDHQPQLKNLFVQLGLMAQQMGLAQFKELAFDGTRVRANNRRHGSKRPDWLRQAKLDLAERADDILSEMERLDQESDSSESGRLLGELADVTKRQQQIAAAVAELEKLEAAGRKTPRTIPLTDPQSRVGKNKHGGHAPNYTPVVGVDVDSGLIVTTDVLSETAEEHRLLAAVDEVTETYGQTPEAVLADEAFSCASNLKGLEEQEVTLYSPPGHPVVADNPAEREDLRQPVPIELRDQLPTRKTRSGPQLAREAFVYDAEGDRYWCPEGKPLSNRGVTERTRADGTVVEVSRYRPERSECEACPLRPLCNHSKSCDHSKSPKRVRTIERDNYEGYRERHAERMRSESAQQAYRRRSAPGERPFAVIKRGFGVDQFLLRGLERVRTEWCWLTTAFNIKCLLSLVVRARVGPAIDLSY